MAQQFEIALAAFEDGSPRRVTLIGRSADPRIVEVVRRFFERSGQSAVPLHQRADCVHLAGRRPPRRRSK
jgi:hypothetical protein